MDSPAPVKTRIRSAPRSAATSAALLGLLGGREVGGQTLGGGRRAIRQAAREGGAVEAGAQPARLGEVLARAGPVAEPRRARCHLSVVREAWGADASQGPERLGRSVGVVQGARVVGEEHGRMVRVQPHRLLDPPDALVGPPEEREQLPLLADDAVVVGVQGEGPRLVVLRLVEATTDQVVGREDAMALALALLEGDGPQDVLVAAIEDRGVGRERGALDDHAGHPGMREREVGVEGGGTLQALEGDRVVVGRVQVVVVLGLEQAVVGLEARGRFAARLRGPVGSDPPGQGRDDDPRDAVDDVEQVARGALVRLRPDGGASPGVGELDRDLQTSATPPDAARQQIVNPERPPDRARVPDTIAQRERRLARDDEQGRELRQRDDHVLGDPVAEPLLAFAGLVLERHHRHRGLGGQRQRGQLRAGRQVGGGGLGANRAVQREGGGLGPDAEGLVERVPAQSELLERLRTTSRGREHLHQAAVGLLARRLEGEPAFQHVLGAGQVAIGTARGGETAEQLAGGLRQVAPLGSEPGVERLLGDGDVSQELTAVQCGRGLPVIACRPAREAADAKGVDVERRRDEADGIVVADEHAPVGVAKRGPERRQGLPQVRAGALVAHLAPQQRGELLARLGAVRVQGQVGEQGSGLLRADLDRLPIRAEQPEGTENEELGDAIGHGGRDKSYHRGRRGPAGGDSTAF